jgi:hypothetical protein
MDFSRRTRLDLSANALSRALEARRARGEEVLDLTASNPTACGFEYPKEVLSALADPRALAYRPSPQGDLEARRAVMLEYARLGVEIAPEQIVLTASTSEAYAFLFKLLCDPGDEVMVPRPSYPLFDHLCALEQVAPRAYALRYDGAWHLDLASVRAGFASGRARAVVAVSPNNPTGSFLKRDETAELTDLCAAHGAALVCDEVFADYAWEDAVGERVTTVAGSVEALTFALGGLSKSAALPQMKVAWICASGPPRALREALDRLDLIADTFLSVSTPAQLALPAWLRAGGALRAQVLARVRQNRARLLAARPASAPWDVLHAEGGWYAVVRVPQTRGEEAWALELLSRGVYVHPGYFFDFPTEAYLIVSLLPEPALFAEGVARIAALISP